MDPTLYTTVRGQTGQRTYAQLTRCLLLGEIPLRIQRGEQRLALFGVQARRPQPAERDRAETRLPHQAHRAPSTQHLGVLEAFLPDDFADAHRRFTVHLGQPTALIEQWAPRALARMTADLP
jgi:hypothetical protein